MYLILGTPECKFCTEAKALLNSKGLKYLYTDLGANWKDYFTILKPILGLQRTIPIVFQGGPEPPSDISIEALAAAGWKIVGTFADLEDHITDIDISDDY
jgi:glutaredoxin